MNIIKFFKQTQISLLPDFYFIDPIDLIYINIYIYHYSTYKFLKNQNTSLLPFLNNTFNCNQKNTIMFLITYTGIHARRICLTTIVTNV